MLDCPAYARLSHPAKALLFEVARQFVRDNNGRLLASRAYLAKRGWHSPDVISRAKRDLLEAGFIHETVTGQPQPLGFFAPKRAPGANRAICALACKHTQRQRLHCTWVSKTSALHPLSVARKGLHPA